jgi:hypothetical protein
MKFNNMTCFDSFWFSDRILKIIKEKIMFCSKSKDPHWEYKINFMINILFSHLDSLEGFVNF